MFFEFLPEIASALGSVGLLKVVEAFIARKKNKEELFTLSIENQKNLENFWKGILEGREDVLEEFHTKLVNLEKELLEIRHELSRAKARISTLKRILSEKGIDLPEGFEKP